MRKINDEGIAHLKKWEGLRLKAYYCAGNVLTIGYGSTGPHVKKGMVITAEEAEALLRKDLERFERAVERLVKVQLTDNQFSALVSFVYNVGEGAFAKSTLLKKLNAGNYDAVPGELAKWNKAGGKRLQGLVNRRAAEAGLWAKGEFVASREITAEPEKLSAWKTPEAVGTVLSGASGVAVAASEPGPLQWAFAIAIVVGVAVVAFYFVKRIREQNA